MHSARLRATYQNQALFWLIEGMYKAAAQKKIIPSRKFHRARQRSIPPSTNFINLYIAEMVRRAAALVAHSQCAKPEPRRCFLSSLFFPRAQVRPKPPWRVSWVRQGRQDLERAAPSTCASLNPSRLACIPFSICAHIPEQCYVTCLLCSGLFLLRFFNPH